VRQNIIQERSLEIRQVRKTAQMMIYDVIVFFVIMMLVVTMVHTYAEDIEEIEESRSNAVMDRYCDEALSVLLLCTMPSTYYLDENGNEVPHPPASTRISDLLIEELVLLEKDMSRQFFIKGTEVPVLELCRALVPPAYDFRLTASLNSSSISMSSTGTWVVENSKGTYLDISSSSVSFPLPKGQIIVTLELCLA